MDNIRIYTELSDATDAAVKSIIPGRSPWTDRRAARAWLSAEYAGLVQSMADAYGVTAHAIKVRGPGVSPFFPGVSALFGSPSWERTRDRNARQARRQERDGQRMAARYAGGAS